MNPPPILTSGMLENLTVNVSYAQVSTKYPGWNRTNETPAFGRFYYIDKGEGTVSLNGVTYYPKPGQLMIMPAGTSQTTDTSRNNPYTRYFCHFDALIGEWPLFHAADKLYICDAPDRDAVRNTFTDLIFNFHKNDFFSKMRTQASLMNLLALCLESGGYLDFMNEFVKTSDQEKLTNVLNFIEERLNWPLEVDDLAEMVHLHPNYFIPYFKKFVGVSPMKYVQLKRMEYAKRLLSYSDSSISGIAEQVGMELAHFSKSFKKNTGVSPSAYRDSTK